jgi:hypothetical protein
MQSPAYRQCPRRSSIHLMSFLSGAPNDSARRIISETRYADVHRTSSSACHCCRYGTFGRHCGLCLRGCVRERSARPSAPLCQQGTSGRPDVNAPDVNYCRIPPSTNQARLCYAPPRARSAPRLALRARSRGRAVAHQRSADHLAESARAAGCGSGLPSSSAPHCPARDARAPLTRIRTGEDDGEEQHNFSVIAPGLWGSRLIGGYSTVLTAGQI